ncbi:hypothetical protein JQC72_14140 [Polycladomyces sp. WAk]|uniref:Uncharacterized protein n=1 Tax=Polycladomyces zharkentensis TaxID=2807616 RepID=A0ABS2WM83_9BACL|nr:hypothetical protein [Polycladomyces sp. WAk]MBN2910639.1 hypothetical protein [Polycladomyces sp. WAk]
MFVKEYASVEYRSVALISKIVIRVFLRRLTLVFPARSTVDPQGSKQVRFETATSAGKNRHRSNIWQRFLCFAGLLWVVHPENLRSAAFLFIVMRIDPSDPADWQRVIALEGIARTSALAF